MTAVNSCEDETPMPMDRADPLYLRLFQRLMPHGQEHLLQFWPELTAAERESLADEILGLNLDLIDKLFCRQAQAEDWTALANQIGPPPAFRLADTNLPTGAARARAIGEEALSDGKVGVVITAGGEGTRLGFPHPKGMYPIGPVSQASLFQILLEKVVATSRRLGVQLPVYVMTSPATHDETVTFLTENERFGVAAGDLHVFCQGTLPAVCAETGRLLLAEKGRLALSPDGHGGTVAALEKSGMLAQMRERGVAHVFYCQIDNPLVPLVDPVVLGHHVASSSDMTTLAVAKHSAEEKMGNIVAVGRTLRIIEYSDLPPIIAQRKNPDGSLALWAGNTAIHLFRVDLLTRALTEGFDLPYHVARKEVRGIDPSGTRIEPGGLDAVKFERFIFDLLPLAQNAVVVEADRLSTFAPLKNPPDAASDNPRSVRAQMAALYKARLEAAGASVADGVTVEISPLFADGPEKLREKLAPGTHVTSDTYLH